MTPPWYTEIPALEPTRHNALAVALLGSHPNAESETRALQDPGTTLLLLAALEGWEFKTDNYCLMSSLSRPTGRKRIRTYLDSGLAQIDDQGNLSAAAPLLQVAALRAQVFSQALLAYEDAGPVQLVSHALSRFDYACVCGLLPLSSPLIPGLLLIDGAMGDPPRRTRNLLQNYHERTRLDLEPSLRRWLLDGWVESTDEHFFNDRFLTTTALGRRICDDTIALLAHCLDTATCYGRKTFPY